MWRGFWSESLSVPAFCFAFGTCLPICSRHSTTVTNSRCFAHSYKSETFHAEMSNDELKQVRARIDATQTSVRESLKKQQELKAEDDDFICFLWNQYETFTGPAPRTKRTNDNLGASTNATKKPRTTHTESEIRAGLDVDNILARHCEDSAVKFSKACALWDSHERNSGLGAGEAYRNSERRRQIAILKYMGFEFNSSVAEVDQISDGRIWLQCMLHQYAP